MLALGQRNCFINYILRNNGGKFPHISQPEIEHLRKEHRIQELYTYTSSSSHYNWLGFASDVMKHPAPYMYRGVSATDNSCQEFKALVNFTSGSIVLFGNVENTPTEFVDSGILHELGHLYRHYPTNLFDLPPFAGGKTVDYLNGKGTEFFADTFAAGFLGRTEHMIKTLVYINEKRAMVSSSREDEVYSRFTQLALANSKSHPSHEQRIESLHYLDEEGFLEDLIKNFSPEALLELCDMAPFNIVPELHR